MADRSKPPGVAIGALVALLLIGGVSWKLLSKRAPADGVGPATGASAEASATLRGARGIGLSAPIAAARGTNGSVFVAGLDVPSKSIRVQQIDSANVVTMDRVALGDVAWSSDAELKLATSAEGGAAVTWRGLRAGKLVRHLVFLDPDLTPRGEPIEATSSSCATRDAVWLSDGKEVVSRPWRGPSVSRGLPKEAEASLLCSANRAFAVLEEDERTSVLALGAEVAPSLVVLRGNDVADEEQRELSEYTIGDDVGIVVRGGSGALALREIRGGVLGTLRRLKTRLPKDADVVAVDASEKVAVIAFTEDASAACPSKAGHGDSVVSTRVSALRVSRETFEESVVELSAGQCGRELGPFFTGVVADGVSVAWAERAGGHGTARAPIVGLAHATARPSGPAKLERVEQAADALVDAGCDGRTCAAVALARGEGMDVMVPGFAKVIRY